MAGNALFFQRDGLVRADLDAQRAAGAVLDCDAEHEAVVVAVGLDEPADGLDPVQLGAERKYVEQGIEQGVADLLDQVEPVPHDTNAGILSGHTLYSEIAPEVHGRAIRAIGDPAERFREDRLRLIVNGVDPARFGLFGASAGGYLAWAYAQGTVGFPLDDAWIHQTYARNLAETGQLAFLAGQPSAGSTSVAWSFLLSAGYMLGVDYRLWAYLLGAIGLVATAWLAYRLFLRLSPSKLVTAFLTGLFCAVEWHLVWAAASGIMSPALPMATVAQPVTRTSTSFLISSLARVVCT